jgi:hypothetical protein
VSERHKTSFDEELSGMQAEDASTIVLFVAFRNVQKDRLFWEWVGR